jgi:hypothetical protein
MALVTGAEVIALAGVPRATPDQLAWADTAAAAITAAVEYYLEPLPAYYRAVLFDELGDPRALDESAPGYAEIKPAAELAAVELYKRREAPFGSTSYADAYGQAIRLSRDYLHPILPTLRRWHPTAGVVAS